MIECSLEGKKREEKNMKWREEEGGNEKGEREWESRGITEVKGRNGNELTERRKGRELK